MITIDGVDVTKQVAAMYDAIVLVGKLAGFNIPGGIKPPQGVLPARDAQEDHSAWYYRRKAAQEKWERQYLAELDARIAEMKGQV